MLCFVLPVTADVSSLPFTLASNGPTLRLPVAHAVLFPSICLNFGCAERYPQVSNRKRDGSVTGDRGLHLQIKSLVCVYMNVIYEGASFFFSLNFLRSCCRKTKAKHQNRKE